MTATSPLPWTPHPIVDRTMPPLSLPEIQALLQRENGEKLVFDFWKKREDRIKAAEEDPLHRGFEFQHWTETRRLLEQRQFVFVFGGNGPGKTHFGGKYTVQQMCQNRFSRSICIATDDTSSRVLQQGAVYRHLPVSLRTRNEAAGSKRRDWKTKVTYSMSNGFTNGDLVLPNGSRALFKTKAQFEKEPISFEGMDWDWAWLDEPVPLALVDVIQRRCSKRGGKILHTFTSADGFTAVCAKVLDGARMVKSLPMNWDWNLNGPNPDIQIPELEPGVVQVKGLPPGHMPYILQPLDPSYACIFWWTHWNDFLARSKEHPAVPQLFESCRNRGKSYVRLFMFGWAEKVMGCKLPAFNPNVHVVPHEKIAKMLKDGQITPRMSADPHTGRSYFLQWAGVDALGRHYIFDESPRRDEGEWVGPDGKPGDGARNFARAGINWYKRHIREREREHGAEARVRKGDPRAFATQAAAAEGGTSLFDLFAEEGDEPELAAMYFDPAHIRQTVDLDLEKITALLADYDEEKPITVENEPKLFVSDRCQNTIACLLNFQGEPDSPYKDGVDATRYNFDEDHYYADPNVPEIVGGRGWA